MVKLGGLAGVMTGTALGVLAFAASVVIAPPVQDQGSISATEQTSVPQTPDAILPSDTDEPPAPAPDTDTALEDLPADPSPSALPDMSRDAEQDEEEELAQDAPASDPATATQAPDPVPTTGPSTPEPFAALSDDAPADLPLLDRDAVPRGLPLQPLAPRDQPLPTIPDDLVTDRAAPEQGTDTDDAPPEPRLPGTQVLGLPGLSITPPQTDAASPDTPEQTLDTALERNSSFTGTLSGGPMMSIILNDPGLPMPLRRSLAALELAITIALNPMDPSAADAAEIYRAAGKEVLILASGVPEGARPTDLDVTFSAYFDQVPQAVGVLDLPQDGFARNAGLTSAVLPLLARDGHGLVTFAGGLSRVASVAQTEGVPHAEAFRVLDDDGQNAFTIRRYLDRAVFQASQIGEVIVFGDATNDATMEALELWRSDGRADQVAVVPISAILLTR